MSDIPGAHNRLWHPELAKRDAEAEKVKPKRRHTCPVCGHEVDEPISSDDLEEANADRFFQDAIDDEEAGK